MRIRFLDIARKELDEAIDYYEYEVPGLGRTFLTETLHALDRIGAFPEAWALCSERTRRCQMCHFPYGNIYYQLRRDEILVVAIANLHRKPDYWRERIA